MTPISTITSIAGSRLGRPARRTEAELLDGPAQDPHVLAGNMDDMRRANRWLGGDLLTWRALAGMSGDNREITLLDVACGDGSMAGALARRAGRRGLALRVIATDISRAILVSHRDQLPPDIGLGTADALRLPFRDRAVDVVACSMALHHMAPSEAVVMLREMARVSRRGIIVNDLVRNWWGLAGAWLLSRLFTRNPMTRHDAPLSVRRAYTRSEIARLAARAGLTDCRFYGFLGYRVAMAASAGR